MLVKEIMRTPVTVVPVEATLSEADHLPHSSGFRHLTVVDRGRLVDVLTGMDLLDALMILTVDSNQIRPLAEALRQAAFTVLWTLPKPRPLP